MTDVDRRESDDDLRHLCSRGSGTSSCGCTIPAVLARECAAFASVFTSKVSHSTSIIAAYQIDVAALLRTRRDGLDAMQGEDGY
jgi:hypothetical protein